jgi:hypothetical protein
MSSDTAARNVRRLTAVLIAALAIGGCATSEPLKGRFLLHPLPPPQGEGYSMSAGALLFKDAAMEVAVSPLDQTFVEGCLTTEGRLSPFAPADPSLPAPLIFDVRLRNIGTKAIYFNPAQVRGMDDREERYLPLAYSDAYLAWRDDPKSKERLDTFTALCFERPVELQPGQEVKKYLPFSSHEEVPKSLTLTLPLMLGGSESRFLFFTFEAFPAEEPTP